MGRAEQRHRAVDRTGLACTEHEICGGPSAFCGWPRECRYSVPGEHNFPTMSSSMTDGQKFWTAVWPLAGARVVVTQLTGMAGSSWFVGRSSQATTLFSSISPGGSRSARGQLLFRKAHDHCAMIGEIAFTPDSDDWDPEYLRCPVRRRGRPKMSETRGYRMKVGETAPISRSFWKGHARAAYASIPNDCAHSLAHNLQNHMTQTRVHIGESTLDVLQVTPENALFQHSG